MRKRNVLFVLILAVFALSVFTSQAIAKPFYEGKTLTLIVTTKPGGGYDFYARLVGKYMQKYLPGSTIIVKNVPGAGHVIGCNTIYHAKPDGLTFGTFNRALGLSQAVGMKGIKFDQAKMSWIGIANTELFAFIASNEFKDIDAVMKADKFRLTSEGIGAINYLAPKLFAYMAGLDNFSVGTGYGGSEFQLAIMRGEADGAFGSWTSWQKFVKEGNGHPVMFIGRKKPAGYENVPLIQEVVTEEKHRPTINLMIAINALGRPYAGPPGIPADRLQILREAFQKACNDPELIALAEKTSHPIDYVDGETAATFAKDILGVPPDVLAQVKKGFGME
jgi:tripartite-type tricarboxylate transporter receptor subunit TctC